MTRSQALLKRINKHLNTIAILSLAATFGLILALYPHHGVTVADVDVRTIGKMLAALSILLITWDLILLVGLSNKLYVARLLGKQDEPADVAEKDA